MTIFFFFKKKIERGAYVWLDLVKYFLDGKSIHSEVMKKPRLYFMLFPCIITPSAHVM
jgi:hypothetical protein